MKKLALFLLCGTLYCSNGMQGVSLEFIRDEFNLPSQDPVIVNLDETGVCPKIEFDSENTTSFQIRIEEDNPPKIQSTFRYADDEYEEDGNARILRGENDSGSTFELSFDGEETYTIIVDYNCENATDPDCVNTSFSCSGPLVKDK